MLTSTATFRARVSAHPKTARRDRLVDARIAMPPRAHRVEPSAGNVASRRRVAAVGGPVAVGATSGFLSASPRRPTRLRGSSSEEPNDATNDLSPETTRRADSDEKCLEGGDLETFGDVLDAVKRELFPATSGESSDASQKRSSFRKHRTLALALVGLIAIHVRDPGWGIWNTVRVVGSLALGAGLAFKGYKSGSLDVSGAVGASLVGWGTLYAGVRFGFTLGVFFFASSAMTKVGSAVKSRIDEHYDESKKGSPRNWIQVAANGAVPTFLAMGYAFATGGPEYVLGVTNAFETPLAVAFIGYYACCGGDTWASELGVLSKTPPRLITNPGKIVAPGTNGGVTPLGLTASCMGGLAVGFAFWCGGLFVPLVTGQVELALRFAAQWPVLLVGAAGGFVGSLIDSVLGATVQFSGFCETRKRVVSRPGPGVRKISGLNFLSNSAVNFVSAVICAVCLYYGTIRIGLPRP